jgi:hypothetical protein
MEDLTLICADCDTAFLWISGERQFFADGLWLHQDGAGPVDRACAQRQKRRVENVNSRRLHEGW